MQSSLRVFILVLSTQAIWVAAVNQEKDGQRRLVRNQANVGDEQIEADGTVRAFTSSSSASGDVKMTISAAGRPETMQARRMSLLEKAPKQGQKILAELQEMVKSGQAPDTNKIDVIKNLVTGSADDPDSGLLPDLKATRQNAIDQMGVQHAAIASCNANSTARQTSIGANDEADVNTRKANHSSCRDDEKDKTDARDAACNELTTALAAVPTAATRPADGERSAMVDWVEQMSGDFCDLGPQITDLDNKCTEHTDNTLDHKRICDQAQAQFESGFCQWRTDLRNACTELDTCYASAKATFDTFVEETKVLEAKWKVEFSALKKILCYCDVWSSAPSNAEANADVDADKYASCNADIDTSEMDITYPTADAQIDCSTAKVDVYPGSTSGDFRNQHYGANDWIALVGPEPMVTCQA